MALGVFSDLLDKSQAVGAAATAEVVGEKQQRGSGGASRRAGMVLRFDPGHDAHGRGDIPELLFREGLSGYCIRGAEAGAQDWTGAVKSPGERMLASTGTAIITWGATH